MNPLNVYLGIVLALLAVTIVLFAIIAAFINPTAAEHLETLAEMVFSLPVFGGATLVWLGGNYKDQVKALVERRIRRSEMGDAATADAALLARIAAHMPDGTDGSAVETWLAQRGLPDTLIDQLQDRGWIEPSSQTNKLMLSDAGGKVLRQWQDRTP